MPTICSISVFVTLNLVRFANSSVLCLHNILGQREPEGEPHLEHISPLRSKECKLTGLIPINRTITSTGIRQSQVRYHHLGSFFFVRQTVSSLGCRCGSGFMSSGRTPGWDRRPSHGLYHWFSSFLLWLRCDHSVCLSLRNGCHRLLLSHPVGL